MRHQRKTVKLQRRADHRRALLANLLCSLIRHRRIRTTLAKAKAMRPLADKLVTLGKRGDLHSRRLAIAKVRDKDAVKILFATIAPAAANRQGGYTRIIKLGPRLSDSAPMALIEWVDLPVNFGDEDVEVEVAKPEAKTKANTETKSEAATDTQAADSPAESEATVAETEAGTTAEAEQAEPDATTEAEPEPTAEGSATETEAAAEDEDKKPS